MVEGVEKGGAMLGDMKSGSLKAFILVFQKPAPVPVYSERLVKWQRPVIRGISAVGVRQAKGPQTFSVGCAG